MTLIRTIVVCYGIFVHPQNNLGWVTLIRSIVHGLSLCALALISSKAVVWVVFGLFMLALGRFGPELFWP